MPKGVFFAMNTQYDTTTANQLMRGDFGYANVEALVLHRHNAYLRADAVIYRQVPVSLAVLRVEKTSKGLDVGFIGFAKYHWPLLEAGTNDLQIVQIVTSEGMRHDPWVMDGWHLPTLHNMVPGGRPVFAPYDAIAWGRGEVASIPSGGIDLSDTPAKGYVKIDRLSVTEYQVSVPGTGIVRKLQLC